MKAIAYHSKKKIGHNAKFYIVLNYHHTRTVCENRICIIISKGRQEIREGKRKKFRIVLREIEEIFYTS